MTHAPTRAAHIHMALVIDQCVLGRLVDNHKAFRDNFERYDLDESGTINETKELKFLVFSLVDELQIELSLPEVITLLK